MNAVADDPKTSDEEAAVGKDSPGVSKDAETGELSPEELQKISGGTVAPHSDWIAT
jgi:hypothetical protein